MPNEKAPEKFVTVRIGSQFFGIPVEKVVDVLLPLKIFLVPLAPKEIIGLINLRGRIVTAFNLKEFFNIKDSTDVQQGKYVVIEYNTELYCFLVDEVGVVSDFLLEDLMKTPDTLSKSWQEVSLGIFPVQDELIVILDINKIVESIVK